MKPAPFEYHRPSTIEEATRILDERPEAAIMAGNQSLGIMMANRLATPDHVVDVNRIEELAEVEIDEETVRLGSTTRHRDVERSSELRDVLPIFPEAAEQIAGPSVRSRGTVGGSVGEADPAGNYPTVLAALDGTVHLVSVDGRREVPAREYFVAYMMTDLAENELIEAVSVERDPFPPDRTGMAFLELKPTAQTWPTVSAATAVRVDDPGAAAPVVEEAWLGLANVADVPLDVPRVSNVVAGEPLSEVALDEVAAAAMDAVDPTDELHADAEFKREVAGEYAKRAIRTAYERAIDGSIDL